MTGLAMHEQLVARLADQAREPAAPAKATANVAASAGDVWAAISESGNLTNIHPFCERNPVERWPGIEARDQVQYFSGITYQRDCLHWSDTEGYDLLVGPPGERPASLAFWTIEPKGTHEADFSIEVIAFVRTDVSPEQRRTYTQQVVERAIPPYLDGVVRGLAHYVETGDPVARNQFGAHDIYSP